MIQGVILPQFRQTVCSTTFYEWNDCAELAGDPHNIQFLTRSEHLRAHGGNFRNITHGHFRIGD